MNKKIVVFAPHPGDETYGCGGTIAKKIHEGYEVIIAIITDGRYLLQSTLGIESDPSPEEVKKIRSDEVISATKYLGVPMKNVVFFNFEDGTLSEHEKEAEEAIIKILQEYPPVEVYFPYIKDFHPDHEATNRIVKKCIQKLGLTPLQYQYFQKHKRQYIGPIIEKMLNLFRNDLIKIDISEFLDLKRNAIKEFKSESSIISQKQKKPLEVNIEKYLKKQEIFYI